MSKKTRSRWFGYLLLLKLFAVALLATGVFYWNYQEYFPNPWTRHIEVAGKIIDTQSREAVPSTRVVITVVNQYGLTGIEKHFYGIVSDSNGEFNIETDTPIDVDWIRIDACSQEGKSAGVETQSGKVVLELDNPEKLPSYKRLGSYEYFTGWYHPRSPVTNMEFFGEGWEIRSPHEIENGVLPAKIR